MKISNNIHFFNSKEIVGKKVDKNLLGEITNFKSNGEPASPYVFFTSEPNLLK